MTDPFLSTSNAAPLQREMQRLLQENKELREKNARLSLQLETASASSRGGGGGALVREPRRRGRPPSSDDGAHANDQASTSSASAAPAKQGGATERALREQLAQEVRARQEAERQLREGHGADTKALALKRQFESFVNATCEREQAYKLVYAGVSTELEERKRLTERLQTQMQEMRKQHQAALERAMAVAPTTASSHASAASAPAKDLSAMEKRLAELERLVSQQQQQHTQGESTGATNSPRKRGGRASKRQRPDGEEAGSGGASLAEEATALSKDGASTSSGPPQPVPPPTPDALVIASGAGALRDDAAAAVAAERATRKQKQQTAKKAPAAKSGRGRGRPRKTAEGDEASSIASSTLAAGSLFANFSALAASKKKPESSAAAGAEASALASGSSPVDAVNFGADPVGEFMSLMERTAQRPHRALLGKKLLAHVKDDLSVLARLVVARHRVRAANGGSELHRLWKEAEWLLDLTDAAYPVLCSALSHAVVEGLGPDAADAHLPTPAGEAQSTAGLAALATLLRLCHLHWTRRGHPAPRPALMEAFLESVVSTLRLRRFGRPGSPMGGADVAASDGADAEAGPTPEAALTAAGTTARLALSQFAAVARALWGTERPWAELIRYYNAGEADAQLRLVTAPASVKGKSIDSAATAIASDASFALYAAQALLPLCLIQDATDKMMWTDLCDSLGWSENQIPLQPLAEAAVRHAAHSTDALRCLRFMTIYKGFAHLQWVMEALRSASPIGQDDDNGSSSAGGDAVFVRLVSFAVMDLRLQDSRDEQWQRTMAYLHDYILAASPGEFNSTEEFVWAATDAHVLAVRALLELAKGLPLSSGVAVTDPTSPPPPEHGGGTSDADARARAESYIATAAAWVAAQRAGLALVEGSGRTPPHHPLVSTVLGQNLLAALPAFSRTPSPERHPQP